jgi:hypothetical protein
MLSAMALYSPSWSPNKISVAGMAAPIYRRGLLVSSIGKVSLVALIPFPLPESLHTKQGGATAVFLRGLLGVLLDFGRRYRMRGGKLEAIAEFSQPGNAHG